MSRTVNNVRYLTGAEVGELLGLDAEVIGFHRRRGLEPLASSARKIGAGRSERTVFYCADDIVWFILHELTNLPDSPFYNPSVHWAPNKRNKVIEVRLKGFTGDDEPRAPEHDGYDALLEQMADPNDYAGEHDHYYPPNIWDSWTLDSLDADG